MPSKTRKAVKSSKRSDADLFKLVENAISLGNYVFTRHSVQRAQERRILEITVLDILEGKANSKRRRNKSKDKFEKNAEDWNYCIEGVDTNQERIRIIVTFERNLMPIITMMWV